jgi:hypothetical protein
MDENSSNNVNISFMEESELKTQWLQSLEHSKDGEALLNGNVPGIQVCDCLHQTS